MLVDDDEDLFDDVLVELDEFEHVDDEDKSSCPCCCCWPRRSSDEELDDPPLLFLLDLVDLLAEDFFERSFEASFDGVLTSGGPAGCDDDDSLSPPPFEFFFSSSSSMSSPTSPAATAATVDSTDELQLLLTAAPSEPVLLLVPPLGVFVVPFEFAVVDDACFCNLAFFQARFFIEIETLYFLLLDSYCLILAFQDGLYNIKVLLKSTMHSFGIRIYIYFV